jgi:lipid A 3-O-deacylase
MCYMRCIILAVAAFFNISSACAQAIGNFHDLDKGPEKSYVRFTYDNDFFTATDRYYTQGIQLAIAAPVFKYNPFNYLLITPGNNITYGISFEHNAYTPTSITADHILYGDRPYTAGLMLNSFAITTVGEKKQRWISSLSLGMLGRKAGGEWMQRGIHEALDNVQPEGWQYQLKNNPIINYSVTHERNLFLSPDHFSVSTLGSVSVGTLMDKADLGVYLMAGNFNGTYGVANRKKFRVHIYANPMASFIAYDATLQGGPFTKGNIYTIAAKDISRVLFSGRTGISFNYAGITLEHFYGFSTKTFKTQQNSGWGGVSMGVAF